MYAVHQRLRYLYGEEYGLTADSEPGNGTCIKICIPFTKEKRRHGVKNFNFGMMSILFWMVCVRSRGRCMDVESSGKRWSGEGRNRN